MKAVWAIVCTMIRELIRRKDFYVLFVFLLALLALLSSQSFFDLKGVSRYVRDLGYSLLMLFSFIIAAVFTAKQIPSEIEARTIYPLLAKPLSRGRFVLGKFFGGFAVSSIAFTVFFAVYAFFYVGSAKGGSPLLLVQGFFLGILFLCLVSALAIFFSNFLTMSATVTFVFLLYAVISGFSDTFRDAVLFSKGASSVFSALVYYLIPHFDFYDMRVRITHAWDPLPWVVVLAITAYTLVYSFLLLHFAGILFKRRSL